MRTARTDEKNKPPYQAEVCVIGAGAAGMTAAFFAASRGLDVVILEKNPRPGKKLNITGKGRCNLTNNCTVEEFFENVPTNAKFLYSAVNAFPPSATIGFFESRGLKLKTEQGRRVFPESGRAADVTDFLEELCVRSGVRFIRGDARKLVIEEKAVKGVEFYNGNGKFTLKCEKAILAAGGASYPATGSDGSGYKIAAKAGHTVTDIKPSLVPLVIKEDFCRQCAGLSLKNTEADFIYGGKSVYRERGEMLFTHFGMSGPVILSASAHIKDKLPCGLFLDLKPALDTETLDKRLLRCFEENKNKNFINVLPALLPAKIIAPFLPLAGIPADKKVNEITREERRAAAAALKKIELTVTGTRPVSEAIITSGGIDTREINPSTMASKIIGGLSFAGEIIDADAYTGGYNLQIAFSTAFAAGNRI